MSTPMHTRALLSALAAPGHTLRRCRGGFHNPTKLTEPTVSRRIANAMAEAGDATFDDTSCPSAITLTAAGVARAQLLSNTKAVAA